MLSILDTYNPSGFKYNMFKVVHILKNNKYTILMVRSIKFQHS